MLANLVPTGVRVCAVAFLLPGLAATAQAGQLPACPAPTGPAVQMIRDANGVTGEFMALCGDRVLVTSGASARVVDTVTGATVHEFAESGASPLGYLRGRNAMYYQGAGYPLTRLFEYDLDTGEKREFLLPRPVYAVVAAVGNHFVVSTAISEYKQFEGFYTRYQMEIFDPGQGTLMPVVGGDFGIPANCSYFLYCGFSKEADRGVGFPLGNHFVAGLNEGGGTWRAWGTYTLDPVSLAIRFNGSIPVQHLILKWLSVTPDGGRVMEMCGGSVPHYCYADVPLGDGSDVLQSNTYFEQPREISPDGQYLLGADGGYGLSRRSAPTTYLDPFAGFANENRQAPTWATFSPDGRSHRPLLGWRREPLQAALPALADPGTGVVRRALAARGPHRSRCHRGLLPHRAGRASLQRQRAGAHRDHGVGHRHAGGARGSRHLHGGPLHLSGG